MTKYTVTAPDGKFSGEFAGLVFRNGKAQAETPEDFAVITYCSRRGYGVVAVDGEGEPLPDGEQPDADTPDLDVTPADDGDDGLGVVVDRPTRPADYASKADWVAYALDVDKDLTRDAAEALTKNDLIEKYGKDNR